MDQQGLRAWINHTRELWVAHVRCDREMTTGEPCLACTLMAAVDELERLSDGVGGGIHYPAATAERLWAATSASDER